MAYTKTTWVDGETQLSAANMNHIEDGIANAVNKAGDTMTGALTVAQPLTVSGSSSEGGEIRLAPSTSSSSGDLCIDYYHPTAGDTWRVFRTSPSYTAPLCVNMDTGEVTISDHSSAIGTIVESSGSTGASGVTSATITSIALGAGTWVITGSAQVQVTSANRVLLDIATGSSPDFAHQGSTSVYYTNSPAQYYRPNVTLIVKITSATTYNLLLGATSALTYANYLLRAVRIA